MIDCVEELDGHADEHDHLGIVFRKQGGEGNSQAVRYRRRRAEAEEDQCRSGPSSGFPSGRSPRSSASSSPVRKVHRASSEGAHDAGQKEAARAGGSQWPR